MCGVSLVAGHGCEMREAYLDGLHFDLSVVGWFEGVCLACLDVCR